MKTSLVFGCTLLIAVKFVKAGPYDQLIQAINTHFETSLASLEDDQKTPYIELQKSLLTKIEESNTGNPSQISPTQLGAELNTIITEKFSNDQENTLLSSIQYLIPQEIKILEDKLTHPEQSVNQVTTVVAKPPIQKTNADVATTHPCRKYDKDQTSNVLYYHKGFYLVRFSNQGLGVCLTNEESPNDLANHNELIKSMNTANDNVRRSINKIGKTVYMPHLELLRGDKDLHYYLYTINADQAIVESNQTWIKANVRSFIEMYFTAVSNLHKLGFNACITNLENILLNGKKEYVFFADFGIFKPNLNDPDCFKKKTKPEEIEPAGSEGSSLIEKLHYQEKISAYTLLELLCHIFMKKTDPVRDILYRSGSYDDKVKNIKSLFASQPIDKDFVEYILRQAGLSTGDKLNFVKRASLFNKRLLFASLGIGTLATKFAGTGIGGYLFV